MDNQQKAKAGLPRQGERRYAAHDVVPHGVRFRYEGDFVRYECTTSLPGWLGVSSDPNHWDTWELLDFVPAKGRRLLIPTRLRIWQRCATGSSLTGSVFLIARTD